ncbi:hypothetical protein GCM10027290_45090 [Micromonospora sonneratiae]
MPGTNPPPSIRTFFHEYDSTGAADAAGPVANRAAIATDPVAMATATTVTADARAPPGLLRMYGFLSEVPHLRRTTGHDSPGETPEVGEGA